MKILLLGANGGIGKHVMNFALSGGDEVIAYVRRPDSLNLSHKNLTVAVGNLGDAGVLEKWIAETDAVISALGPHMDMGRKVKSTPIADAHRLILRLMEKHGKRRFITMGTPTVQAKDDQKHYTNTILPYIPKLLFPTGYVEYRLMGEIMEASPLDWTVVRFLDPKAKKSEANYQIVLDGRPKGLKISRENIGHFMYKVAKENTYIRQMPMIFH